MHGTRSTRSKKESLDAVSSQCSVFLSFFLLPPSVSSVTQFVVSSRFYESNKLYLAAGHGRWVMGARRGRLSLSVSLSVRVVRRKSTQDRSSRFSHHGRTFSSNEITRIPFYPRRLRACAGMEISWIWIKGDAGYLFIFRVLIGLERSVVWIQEWDGTDDHCFD